MSIPTPCLGIASRQSDNDALGVGDRDGRQIVSLRLAPGRGVAVAAGVVDDRQIGRVTRRISGRAARGGAQPPWPRSGPRADGAALHLRTAQREAGGLFLRAKLDLLQDVPPHRPSHVAWRSEPDGDGIACRHAPGSGNSSPIKIVSGDRNTSR